MAPNPTIMQAVERLGYRVTVGDVASQAGLEINLAEQGLLTLAAEAGGHLQVAESGEIAYLFPKDFRSLLRNKYFRLRLKEWWDKVWRVLFYLIRISFGIVLIASILLIFITIFVILIAVNSSRDSSDSNDDGGGMFLPNFWFSPDFFWIFSPNYYDDRRYEQPRSRSEDASQLNFLEAVFSFLFGDGNPNADLEKRRWQTIATVIRNHRGAIVAEQLAPYLDDLGQGHAQEYEEYLLPVLTRFNGRPEVSPTGDLVYHFPELQTTAAQKRPKPVSAYLQELPWRFSQASSGQLIMAAGLGGLNLVGALVLGKLLSGGIAVQLGGFVALVQSLYWVLLAYGVAFLTVPLGRYFWLQWRNGKIGDRNAKRQSRAIQLNQASAGLREKVAYAQQFAAETVIDQEDLAYTTERDLIEQDIERSAQIDAAWEAELQKRLKDDGSNL